MNKTLKESREMKESGIEWIGQIPKTWEVIPNKYVMKKIKDICIRYDNEDILSLTMNGVIIRDLDNPTGKMPTTFDGYQRLSKGNLLMCLFDIDVTPRCIGLINNNGLTSPAYSQFTLKNGNIAKYYYYYYLNLDFTKELLHLSKNLRNSLTENLLGAVKVPRPPIHEQQAIANYLDKQVGKIDELIVEQKQAIEKWKEYKQSLITETVTKGLNPDAEMKDSEIEWIGQIPKGWKLCKIKHVLRFKSIKNKPDKEVLSLYRDHGVIPKNSRDDNFNVTSENTASYKFVEVGDFVVNKMKAWQGSMALSHYEGIISPAYYVYQFIDNEVFGGYFHYLVRNQTYLPEYRRLSGGVRIGQWDLSRDDFKMIPIIIPPLHEQKEIANYLDEKCSKIDQTIEQKNVLIKELEEYKQSLIYECVTGKRCVL